MALIVGQPRMGTALVWLFILDILNSSEAVIPERAEEFLREGTDAAEEPRHGLNSYR